METPVTNDNLFVDRGDGKKYSLRVNSTNLTLAITYYEDRSEQRFFLYQMASGQPHPYSAVPLNIESTELDQRTSATLLEKIKKLGNEISDHLNLRLLIT